MRYFLLDKITDVKVGEYAKGLKAITLTDPVLHDHFPDYPIMPGALIIEGLAQLAGFFLEVTCNQRADKTVRAILMQVDRMKFTQTSGPGEVLEYTATLASLMEDAARVNVEARGGGELRAKGNLNFHLREIDSANVTNQRLYIYRILTRDLPQCPPLR